MRHRKRFGRKRKRISKKAARLPFKKAARPSSKLKWILFIFFTFFVLLITFGLLQFDEKIMPPILASYNMQATTRINEAISRSVTKIINEKYLEASDFYIKNTDENGRINSLSVNTMLVNEICNRTAVEISRELEQLGSTKIEMPSGAVLGINFLANMGPTYTISILPVGSAVVDYNSKFESGGINQINFQVWLNIKTTVEIVNPFQNNQITVTKDVPLVNTVFSGEVPSTYFNMEQASADK